MMEKQQCSWSLCSGSEGIMEEYMQQKNAKRNRLKLTGLEHYQLNIWQQNRQRRPVFSFRHNCFRQYNDSDKRKWVDHEKILARKQTILGIHGSKSISSLSLMSTPHKILENGIHKYFISPPPKYQIPPKNLKMETISREYSDRRKYFDQHCVAPQIIQNSPRMRGLYEEQGVQNKCLAETQYSSKTSEICSRLKEPVQALKFSFVDQSYSRRTSSQHILEKANKNCIFVESVHNSTINPSFKCMEQAEPKKFFPHVNTIKTILTTSNEYKECYQQQLSLEKSNNQFEEHYSEYSVNDLNSSSCKFNKIVRNKRKTAYFGCVKQTTQRSIIKHLNDNPFQQLNKNQANEFQKSKRKTYNNQSSMHQSFLIGQKVKNCKENETTKNQHRVIIESSLHNIIQSTQRQKLSIQNSIKDIKLVSSGSTQDNGMRFKYVNTIKSIGGESALSENSYIDIKFMQNIRQKRGIVKLV